MVVFKAVSRKTRRSSNFALFMRIMRLRLKNNFPHTTEFSRKDTHSKIIAANEFIRQHKDFFPRYTKGSIVKAAKHTYGIFTFQTYYEAEEFIEEETTPYGNKGTLIIIRVIRVKGIGKPIIYPKIARGIAMFPWTLLDQEWCEVAPVGSIGFPSVKVLE